MTELGQRVGQSRPAPPRARPRARTRRRQLQRWGAKHARPVEELPKTLEAMTASAQRLTSAPGDEERVRQATDDAEAFLTAVEAAQALPAAPDPSAQGLLAQALALWHAGAVLQLASIDPFRAEDSSRAAAQIAQGVDKFARFAQMFLGGQ